MKKQLLISIYFLLASTSSNASNASFYMVIPFPETVTNGFFDQATYKNSWDEFATTNSLPLPVDGDWSNGINWYNYSISSLPTDPYPSRNLSGAITLQQTNISNIDSLSQIKTASSFNLRYMPLANLDGLASLESVGSLLVARSSGSTESIQGLSNLKTVNSRLSIVGTVPDISPLASVISMPTGGLELNANPPGVKIPSGVYLCHPDNYDLYKVGYLKQHEACDISGKDLHESAWNTFTAYKNVVRPTDGDWSLGLNWYNDNLSALPPEPYPETVINGSITLQTNLLEHFDSFSNVTTINGDFNARSNPITSLNGFSSLTSISGSILLSSGTYTNLDGLASLSQVGGTLELNVSSLNDISGLAGITSIGVGKLLLAAGFSGTKIPGTAYLCQIENADKFASGYLQQADACAP